MVIHSKVRGMAVLEKAEAHVYPWDISAKTCVWRMSVNVGMLVQRLPHRYHQDNARA